MLSSIFNTNSIPTSERVAAMTGSNSAFTAPPAASVTTHLDAVEALLETAQKGPGGLPMGERNLLLKGVAHLREHLGRPSFRCPVFGITKAGKSTLLNALLGQELLASSNVPITRVALDLVHNPSLDAPELSGPEGKLKGVDAIKARLARLESQATGEAIPWRLDVAMPFLQDLPVTELHFTLVDTPGVTEAGGAALSRSTLDQITSADAAILVMNIQDLHTLGEQAFLEQVTHKRPDLFFRPNRTFFFAVSKADIRNRNSTPFGQIARVIGDQIRSALPDNIALANPKFLPVKGEQALLARVATLPEAGDAVRLDYTRILFGAGEQQPKNAATLQRYAARSLAASGLLELEQVLRTLAVDMARIRPQTVSMRLHHLVNRALQMARIHQAVDLGAALQAVKERIRNEAPASPARS